MSILIWTALERCQNDGNVPDLTLILAFYHAPYFAFNHTFSRQNTRLTWRVPTLNQHLQRPRATWEQARVTYTHGMIRKYTHTHMHATEATFTQYISKDVSFVKQKGPTIFIDQLLIDKLHFPDHFEMYSHNILWYLLSIAQPVCPYSNTRSKIAFFMFTGLILGLQHPMNERRRVPLDGCKPRISSVIIYILYTSW